MTLREITDRNGVRWQVWAVRPSLGGRGEAYDRRAREHGRGELPADPGAETPHIADDDPMQVREEYREGWLAFQSRTERRRLAPIPEGWEESSEDELVALCGRAAVIGRPRRLSE